jgi:hypothetical protein
MLASALDLASSVLWLAAALGTLGAVGLLILPYLWSQWTEAKYGMDIEGELYQSVVDALEEAEGRAIDIVIRPEEKDSDQVQR